MRPSKRTVYRRLAAIYDTMATAYAKAAPAGFTCEGCVQNCCTSYFQHHTYVEWLYLWEGLRELPEDTREAYLARARENVRLCQEARARGETPKVMCPVNDEGRCGLYKHRLMICRMYGVPNMLLGRNGLHRFPGCPVAMERIAGNPEAPMVDRTPLYRELARLEMDFMGSRKSQLPKVDLTLSEMIVAGPPQV